MIAAKRVEIITSAREAEELCRGLPTLGIRRYTLIRHVAGHGKHLDADDLLDVFSNSMIVVICSEAETEHLLSWVVPQLERFGGICTVQDCAVVRPGSSSAA